MKRKPWSLRKLRRELKKMTEDAIDMCGSHEPSSIAQDQADYRDTQRQLLRVVAEVEWLREFSRKVLS